MMKQSILIVFLIILSLLGSKATAQRINTQNLVAFININDSNGIAPTELQIIAFADHTAAFPKTSIARLNGYRSK